MGGPAPVGLDLEVGRRQAAISALVCGRMRDVGAGLQEERRRAGADEIAVTEKTKSPPNMLRPKL